MSGDCSALLDIVIQLFVAFELAARGGLHVGAAFGLYYISHGPMPGLFRSSDAWQEPRAASLVG